MLQIESERTHFIWTLCSIDFPMPRRFFQRFSRIDNLISLKATGKPSELAEKLEISESTLYEFITIMKELGAPIKFDRARNSYVYDPDGRIEIKFLEKK
ncbi:MAG: HTH domain-containing protein [Balneolaceae bacterium]